MSNLVYQNDELSFAGIALGQLAKTYGTPLYVYASHMIVANFNAFKNAFTHPHYKIAYAVKANSNIAILKILNALGAAFDIVSAGELDRVIKAGGDPKNVIFSGIGKREDEIANALQLGVGCFDVESIAELQRINSLAQAQSMIANVALRINPDVDAKTHPHISTGLLQNKFGIALNSLYAFVDELKTLTHINLIGLAAHIGSQITSIEPYQQSIKTLLTVATTLKAQGHRIEKINVGGGYGVQYADENPPSIATFIAAICAAFIDLPYEIIIEPGRAIIADAGVLLTRVEYLKQNEQKNFAIVDAGMTDLLRPTLYDAWQNILPATHHANISAKQYDVVGPVCESADFLGRNRRLAIKQADYLVITHAGAYGYAMSSNYNARLRPAEVLIEEQTYKLIRRRETLKDLNALDI